MSDKDVFVESVDEKPVKPKRVKKPMSEERKQKLREQLAHAREVKKAKKAEELALIKKYKEEPVKEPEKVEEPVKEVVEPVVEKVVVPWTSGVERTKPPPHKEQDTSSLGTPKTILDQLIEMKKEMAELKKGHSSKEDLLEIKELKAEMKELRDVAKAYKKQQTELKKEAKKAKVAAAAPPPTIKLPEPLIHIPKQRYSTYKKSKWAALTNPLQ